MSAETEDSNPETVELEIKITYLEDTVSELNKVVYKQQKSIDQLQDLIRKLTNQVKEIEETSNGGSLPHEKPPHY